MARYSPVDVKTWNDKRFCELGYPPPNAQFLWLYLLTSPYRTVIPGVIRVGLSTVFEQFGWSTRDGLLQAAALVEADMIAWERDLIWLPNALTRNPPANPNVVRGWRKAFDSELFEGELRDRIEDAIYVVLHEFPPAYRQAFRLPGRAKAGRSSAAGGDRRLPFDEGENPLENRSQDRSGTHLRINNKSKISTRTRTPAAGAAGVRVFGLTRSNTPTLFWTVLRLAKDHLDQLRAEPTDSDRMEVLKTICAKHGVIGYGAVCGRVLRDNRIAKQIGMVLLSAAAAFGG